MQHLPFKLYILNSKKKFCREVNDFACFLVPQVQLVNLYYPYAKHVGVPNPFGNQIQLTSLEKVLKTESNGYDVNQRKNVII